MNARDARVEKEIVAPLREVNSPALDELHRARLASAIEAALDREGDRAPAGRTSGGWRWRVWFSTAGIAVAALGAVSLFPGPPTRPQTVAPVARAPETSPSPLLVPYRAGEGAPAPASTLLALAGERVHATIGARVRVTLVGPGRLSVVPAPRVGDFELALDRGRLLVDYDGHAGGTLRVRSPGSLTTVVGTLFAVEATGSGSRVAVARGRVRTNDDAGHVWQVAAGESWTSADGRLGSISEELAAVLVRHEAVWTSEPSDTRPATDEPVATVRPSLPSLHTQPQVDLETLYAEAEAAMRARSAAEARRTLETIVERDRNGRLREAALLDLARLALADGDRPEALRALIRLPHPLTDPALSETADHLRCRAERSSDGGDPCGP
jgi:hypothetical protein